MCLAVPAQILSIDEKQMSALCDIRGAQTICSLLLTPQAQKGDYVLIHAGYAINVIDQAEALKTIAIFAEIEKIGLSTPPEDD